MGVTGLWRLIEPAGKPVPVETLENKVLAVDISIWLHQMVKGYQDAKGAPLPNAHLMGLFQRLCKLLYFRIKPVFVFDGGFPDLKRETIARRQDNKAKYNSESERIRRELALLLSKKSAIGNLLGKEISPTKKASKTNAAESDDLFKLPALPENKEQTESESEDEESSNSSIIDLHSVDIESPSFKNLPINEKYDLLIELKETRKMNSWGKLNELPKKSDNFSDFQMQRLLKRRKVQECLEETEKEMGDGGMSLNDLESLLNEEGIDTKIEALPTRRIASSDTTRFLLINNVKQALEAKKKMNQKNNPGTSKDVDEEQTKIKDELEEDLEKAIKMSLKEPVDSIETLESKDETEDDLEKAIKMSLECVDSHDTSNCTSKTDDSWTSVLTDNDYSDNTDSEEGDGYEQPDMCSAKAYIMQYSDFTNKAIDRIIASKHSTHKNVSNVQKVDQILEEINNKKSVIVDKVDLSSDEDYSEQISNEKNPHKGNDKQGYETDEDLTQASVIYVKNNAPDVITLDTSGEDIHSTPEIINTKIENDSETDKKNKLLLDIGIRPNEGELEIVSELKSQTVKSESNSSDDEFEDVPEIEKETAKPVVQLTLEMGQTCGDDDIFADVFTNKNTSDIETVSSLEAVLLCDRPNSDIEKLDNVKNPTNNISGKDSVVVTDKLNNEFNAEESISASKSVNPINSNNLQESVKSVEIEQTKDAAPLVLVNKNPGEKDKINVYNNAEQKDLQDKSSKTETLKTPNKVISTEKLNEMAEAVANEAENLVQEKSRLDRIGRNITEQMTKEAQELLQLFGIPYIIAPMEAEAQCAFLENVKLTDGTITDDSDIWLFGGRTVYKNFFNQKKHVLQFLSERIEKSYNLTREQLILLALLVGSDYTTGVDGVGPVTAMEILASFPFNKKHLVNESTKQGQYNQIITGMQEFKSWVRAGKRTDNTSLKKKLRNIKLNDDFPSVRVVQAYLEPNVEKSEDKFTWGEIDITILRDYTKTKFGWSQNKLDEIIKPVLKRLQERKSQKTVHDYFKRKVDFQSLELHMSKRVHAAVQQMVSEPREKSVVDESDEPKPESSSKSRKRKINKDNVPKTKTKPAAGPSRKVRIAASNEIDSLVVKAVAYVEETTSGIDIAIPKTDRHQEIIPQREKDKQSLLQNKMKAIELFRKQKIDKKKKVTKRKVILPKEKADLSESSDE